MRLLLDAHLPLAVATQLRLGGIDAIALQDWRGGELRHADDEQILTAAYEERRVLITYDRRTIPPLLRDWAELNQPHAGVILIGPRTIPPHDIGLLVRSLRALAEEYGTEDWHNQASFYDRDERGRRAQRPSRRI